VPSILRLRRFHETGSRLSSTCHGRSGRRQSRTADDRDSVANPMNKAIPLDPTMVMSAMYGDV
jgi:hypothetical protein